MAGALSGRRVLEIGGASGMYCGKLLADLGADVVRIEPEGGDPERRHPPLARAADAADTDRDATSLPYLYLNTNKRSLMLDLGRSDDRALFRALARDADILVESLAPGRLDALGLGWAALEAENPELVMTSITGFGQTGPHRDFETSDLVASAMGGSMMVTGEPEDPPVALASDQAFVMASSCAAAASLIALAHRDQPGGVGQHVDISCQEVMLAVSHICGVGKYLDDGIVPTRNGTSLFASVPSGAYVCRDGLIYLMVNRPLHWKALAQWIHEETGNQEVLDPMFEGPSSARIEYRELLDLFIADMTCKHDVSHLYHEGQRRHIAMAPVHGVMAMTRDPHLVARRFFSEVDQPGVGQLVMPGAPYRLERTPCRIARPAPAAGEHDAELRAKGWGEGSAQRVKRPAAAGSIPARALAGLKAVEFTAGMAGPWIGRFMAWCGAEVVKVESTEHPGVVRLYVPPRERQLGIQPALSPWFTDWDAGKRFVALDLRRPEATELAKKLVGWSDVTIENYSTGVMQKLGLGWQTLCDANPALVHLSTSGYGDEGPNAHYVSWGSNIEAASGLSALSGHPHRNCTITQFAYPDSLSGLHGLVAVMAALDHRRRTGEGQHISLSQLEATIAAAGSGMMEALATGRDPARRGNRSPHMAPHGVYRCTGEDRWCAISVASEAQWQRFCEVVGEPEWRRDDRFRELDRRIANADALDALIERWTVVRDPRDVMQVLQAAGIAAGVAQNVHDILYDDPHLQARGFFEEIPHRKRGTVTATGIPLGLTGTPGRTPSAGADIGQDNDYVFRQLLGMSEEEVRALEACGAIEVVEPT